MKCSILLSLAYLCLCATQILSLLSIFNNTRGKSTQALKKEILDLSRSVKRGLIETPQQRAQMADLFEQLEKKNPNKAPLASPLVNKVWSLEYTTSDAILGRGQSPKVGPILQVIDAINLKAVNSETVRYFNIFNVNNKVTADLAPVSPSQVNVQFKVFTIGPFSFKAPSAFKGSLDVTYLDSEMRLSRGDKGNIFVLTKFSDL